MNRLTKILTFIGIFLLILGSGIFVKALSDNNWEFENIIPNKLQTSVYELDKEFSSISIETDTTDVEFILSTDGKNKVVINEREDEIHQVDINENTLNIKEKDSNKIHISFFNFHSPKIEVYLVSNLFDLLHIYSDTSDINVSKDFTFNNIDIETNTGDVNIYSSVKESLKIKSSTGDVKIENVTAKSIEINSTTGDINIKSLMCDGNLSLNVTTGDIILKDIKCNDFLSKGNTGDISMNNMNLKGKINIKRTTGDVIFSKFDANEIYIETDTGDVIGGLLSEKIFNIDTSTGDKIYPNSTTGGKCEVKTSTGDIIIKIEK